MDESPNPIEVELAGEQAAALGRAGEGLGAALAKLRQFEAGLTQRAPQPSDSAARQDLIARAGEAFWSYIVQREALGLYDEETIARDYGVPVEVRNLGPRIRNSRA